MWQNKAHSSESIVSVESDVSERGNSVVWSNFGDGDWRRLYKDLFLVWLGKNKFIKMVACFISK